MLISTYTTRYNIPATYSRATYTPALPQNGEINLNEPSILSESSNTYPANREIGVRV